MAASKGSCSTVAAEDESGHHLLKIAGYSRIKSALSNGNGVKSDFSLGGQYWRAEYYPNGRRSETTHSISLHLFLEYLPADEIVKAKVTFSLLDHEGNPAPSYTKTTAGAQDFSMAADSFGVEEFINKEALEKSGYLKDDSFTVRIDMTVLGRVHAKRTPYPYPSPKPTPKPKFVVKVPPSDMQQNFADLLTSKEGFDVKFLVGGETVEAHRAVLAARSRVFKAQLFGQMKESATTTDAIRIDDMEAKVFRAMLTFIYTDALPRKRVRQEDGFAMAQHLLVAADRYALERLKLMCEHKLCDHIDAGSLPTLLALADQHHCHGLKEACLSFKSSPITLKAFMESEGFQYLTKTCPNVLKELINPTST